MKARRRSLPRCTACRSQMWCSQPYGGHFVCLRFAMWPLEIAGGAVPSDFYDLANGRAS
jgi:hypothetical protein